MRHQRYMTGVEAGGAERGCLLLLVAFDIL
jgi:hypothetical protein